VSKRESERVREGEREKRERDREEGGRDAERAREASTK
jgi:hypothetical protein